MFSVAITPKLRGLLVYISKLICSQNLSPPPESIYFIENHRARVKEIFLMGDVYLLLFFYVKFKFYFILAHIFCDKRLCMGNI